MNSKNIRFRGFTLIEVTVVITVLAIISAVVVAGYQHVQKTARDGDRDAKASLIADALEDYHAENGEYPGCSQLTGLAVNVSNQTLKGLQPEALRAPLDNSPSANSIICSDLNSIPNDRDVFSYYGDTNQECLTGVSCAKWEITYRKESGETGKIKSRYDSLASLPPQEVAKPTNLNLTASISGSNAVATASGGNCTSEASIQRQIRVSSSPSTSSGSWQAWESTGQLIVPASQGWKYSFEHRARCQGSTGSSDWVSGPNASAIRPINKPATPVVTIAPDTSTVWSWNATSCPTGTTAYYETEHVRDNNNGTDSFPWGPGTVTTRTVGTSMQGAKYTFNTRTQCKSAHATSDWSAYGSKSTVRPISTPANLTITATGTSSSRVTFKRSTGACPSGTSPVYQRGKSKNGASPYDSGWTNGQDIEMYYDSSEQGVAFTGYYRHQCSSAHATSGWSAKKSASYTRPVAKPTISKWVFTKVSNRHLTVKPNIVCGTGASPYGDINLYSYNIPWGLGTPRGGKTGWYVDPGYSQLDKPSPVATFLRSDTTQPPIQSGNGFKGKVNARCKNTTTGLKSGDVLNESARWNY